MIKVSVIIPNYNHAVFLKDRIDSVLNQTFQDFEVIIMDDVSPDNSREVIEGYRTHNKVSQIIYNEINSGSTFKQWEKGIGLAKGEYIWIAESDDWCEPTLLQNLVAAMEDDVSCTMAYVQSTAFRNDGSILWQSKHQKISEYVDGIVFIKQCMVFGNAVFNASMAIFRKKTFYEFSKEFTQYKFCGDWLFWIEMSKRGKVFISGKMLNYFRKHDKDVSGKAYASGLNFIENVKILNSLKKDDIITEQHYKTALIEIYYQYITIKHNFTPDARKLIDNIFLLENDGKYKRFLQWNYSSRVTKDVIKNTVKRFLKLKTI